MKKLSLLLIVTVLAFSSCDWLLNSPVANAGEDQTIILGETITLSGSATISNDAGATYSWSENYAAVTLKNDNTATPTFSATEIGIYIIQLTVTNEGYTSTDSVTITVKNFKANAGNDKTIILGNTTNLYGSSDLSDETNATYSWSENHTEVTLTDDNTATPTFSASETGTYTITLTVTNNGYSSSDTVTITVRDFVVNAGTDKTIVLGNTTVLNGSTDLSDETNATYFWSESYSAVTLTKTNTTSPAFNASVAGTYEITLTVTNNGSSITDTVTITVENFTVNAGTDQSILLGETTTLSGSSDLSDETNATYYWSEGYDTVSIENANTAIPTFSATAAGQYTITLTISNNGSPITDTVMITVTEEALIENITTSSSVRNLTFTFDVTTTANTNSYNYMYAFYYDSETATAPTGVKNESNQYVTDYDFLSRKIFGTEEDLSTTIDLDTFDDTDFKDITTVDFYVQLKSCKDLESNPLAASEYWDKSSYYEITWKTATFRSLGEPEITSTLVTDPDLIAQLDAAMALLEANSSVED